MPVATLFKNLEAGLTVEEVMEGFSVTREQINAALHFAAKSLGTRSQSCGLEHAERHQANLQFGRYGEWKVRVQHRPKSLSDNRAYKLSQKTRFRSAHPDAQGIRQGGMEMTVLDEVSYGKLLSTTLPRVIRDGAELERFTQVLLELDQIENPSREQDELAELLTTLIEGFEGSQFPTKAASPIEVIQFLMEQRGLTGKDLVPVHGSKGTVSDVINGKRPIGIQTAVKLGEFFNVKPELFVEWKTAGATGY